MDDGSFSEAGRRPNTNGARIAAEPLCFALELARLPSADWRFGGADFDLAIGTVVELELEATKGCEAPENCECAPSTSAAAFTHGGAALDLAAGGGPAAFGVEIGDRTGPNPFGADTTGSMAPEPDDCVALEAGLPVLAADLAFGGAARDL